MCSLLGRSLLAITTDLEFNLLNAALQADQILLQLGLLLLEAADLVLKLDVLDLLLREVPLQIILNPINQSMLSHSIHTVLVETYLVASSVRVVLTSVDL